MNVGDTVYIYRPHKAMPPSLLAHRKMYGRVRLVACAGTSLEVCLVTFGGRPYHHSFWIQEKRLRRRTAESA